ncbi:hypothetical protein DXA36_25380 [Eisenbergiella sp. OF01-20]|nr:hypothetical protein DXA36_25380 [Eisenbergiella sp. OF01-20]
MALCALRHIPPLLFPGAACLSISSLHAIMESHGGLFPCKRTAGKNKPSRDSQQEGKENRCIVFY